MTRTNLNVKMMHLRPPQSLLSKTTSTSSRIPQAGLAAQGCLGAPSPQQFPAIGFIVLLMYPPYGPEQLTQAHGVAQGAAAPAQASLGTQAHIARGNAQNMRPTVTMAAVADFFITQRDAAGTSAAAPINGQFLCYEHSYHIITS